MRIVILIFSFLLITNAFGQKAIAHKINEKEETYKKLRSINPSKQSLNDYQLDDYLELVLTVDGKNLETQLFKAKVYSEEYKVKLASGNNPDINKAEHYWGIVKDDTTSLVSLTIRDGEVSGLISYKGENYSINENKRGRVVAAEMREEPEEMTQCMAKCILK